MKIGNLVCLSLALSSIIGCGQGKRTNSLGMEFVPVEGLPGVLFSKFETRVKDFRAFVEDTAFNGGYSYRDGLPPFVVKGGELVNTWDYSWSNPGFDQMDDHPVTCVSWEDAKAFCEWLTRKERQDRKIKLDQEYRLPTDWEWSMAVGLREGREGNPESKNEKIKDIYPWNKGKGTWPPPKGAGNYAGEEARDKDWPSDFSVIEGYNDGYPRTSPVGSFATNANGLYDLGGNVWEWCEDLYSHSMNRPDIVVKLKAAGLTDDVIKQLNLRVLRGGSGPQLSRGSALVAPPQRPPRLPLQRQRLPGGVGRFLAAIGSVTLCSFTLLPFLNFSRAGETGPGKI